jgi:serine/threonine-protein kinase LATS1/2
MTKADALSHDRISSVHIERDILSPTSNPRVVQLKLSFQDRDSLYLIIEYVPGGDIFTALIEHGTFLVSLTRFPPGETTLAPHSIRRLNVFLK